MPTRSRKATAQASAPDDPAKPDGQQEASPDPSPQEAPADPPGEQEATSETRRYRALTAMGRTRRGEEFEATPDDRRVKSGYAQEIAPEAVPDAVADALS